ncbi:MAG: protein kinase, partial [Gemmatimonadetes bacterium]|nr:protein kinase [Gemmatimonadota bacterium]
FRGDFQWGLERFLDEARTLARFDHRHIIKVHRFFEAHGTAYIVMEYAEGETLSAYLERKGTLSEAELKGILYPLLDGLEVVHGADFLHRDIKPGNIVLRDVDGSPVLLDFGAARQAIGAKSRSVTSIVTPGYAPIEQYSSRGHQGAWTDIYALGGVCYRALTGQVPDDATDRVRHDPLVPISQRCAGQASQAFLAAIDLALSVDEGDRPQNVAAWRAVLGADVAVAQERRQEETPRRDTGQAASENQRRERAKDLHTAAKQNDHQAALFLLRHGSAVNARDHDGNTPLHIAAKLNAFEVARVLLNHGSAVNAKNDHGWTPYSFAEEAEMLDLLSHYERLQESSGARGGGGLGRRTQQERIASRNNKSSSEGNMGCITKSLVGMGILVLIGLLSC